ncbi:oligosaccharide flippase family protein [Jatrophihabitans sp. YIM 134969]
MPARAPSIARAVGVQLAGRALGTLASLVTVAVTTRYLGVQAYGVLTAAIVFVSLWSSLTELGVGATIVRKVGDGSGDLHTLVRVNIGLSLLYGIPLTAVCALVGVLLVHRGQSDLAPVLVIVSLGLALQTLSTCLGPVFAVAVRFGPVALGDALSRIGSLAATLLVVTADGGLRWIAAVQLLPPVVVIVVSFLAARAHGPVRPSFDVRAAGRLVRESLPITAVGIVGVLYWRADGLILTLVGDAAEVAAYGLGYTIAFNLAVVSTFYLNSSLSTMTTAFPRDRAEFAGLVRRGLELMLFMGAPVVAFGVPLAGPVVELIGSREFVDVTRVPLMLLLVAVVLTFGTGLVGQALFAAHEQKFLLGLNIVNLVVNIGLNLALAPAFGAVGVGAALIASEVSGLVVCLWKLRRVCGLRLPVAGPVRLLLPVAVGVAVLVPLRHLPVVVPLAAALVAYLGVNLAIGPVTPRVLRGLFARGDVEAVSP